jgi:aminopeptidase N
MKHISILIILVSLNLVFGYLPDTNQIIFPYHKTLPYSQNFSLKAESSHSFDVRHYKLQLQIPMTSGEYFAQATIKLVANENNFDTFNLHFVNLVCDSVKRLNYNLPFEADNGRLKITLDRTFTIGETIYVDIFYRRNPNTANRGVYYYPRGTYPAIIYTTTQPYDSRYWFPCFDENWDKADEGCCIYVTVPDSFVVCSNGLLDSVRSSGGYKTYFWRERYPIATYLMTFTSSIYATYSHWFSVCPRESIEIKYYIWRVDSARSHQAFQNVLDMMSFFVSRFGRYPFEKYGMNAVYPFIWGGMENQTMTMIHRSWLNGNDVGIAHELAHMWFGDKVTCFGWENIWLNEGFATYSDALYMHHQQGENYFRNLMNSRANSYFSEDNSMRFPIYNPPSSQLFSWGHIYCKGSWVLHMLRYILGDTIFDAPGTFFYGLNVYLDSFGYKNASTEDFKRILEQVSGKDLDWFFQEWVYGAGYPKYYYSWQTENTSQPNTYRVITRIAQNNGSLAPSVFHMPLQIKFTSSNAETLLVVDINNNPEIDTFELSFVPSNMVIDPANWILKRSYLGIEEQSNTANYYSPIKLYQNPARRAIILSTNNLRLEKLKISLYNHLGQLLNTYEIGPTNNNRLIVFETDYSGKSLLSGFYFLKLDLPLQSLVYKVTLIN